MDWTQIAAFAAAILTPFLAEGGKAFAAESGKGLHAKVVELYDGIRNKLSSDRDQQSEQILDRFEQSPEAQQDNFVQLLVKKVESDAGFGDVLTCLVTDAQNSLLDCLLEKFTNRDLREVYARLGIGWDDLVAGTLASKVDKANALIEHLKVDGRTSDLVAVMWRVRLNPRC